MYEVLSLLYKCIYTSYAVAPYFSIIAGVWNVTLKQKISIIDKKLSAGYNISAMLSTSPDSYHEFRIKAVKSYLSTVSLQKVALSFGIHPWTLKRWIKWYEQGGVQNLDRRRKYKKPPNRFTERIEKKIVCLKEKNPSITVSNAQRDLGKCGIKISRKGIWGVWKRYGLAGFMKAKSAASFLEYITKTPETIFGVNKAEKAFRKGDVKQAAHILNCLPSCPAIPLLEEIPDRFLSLPRRVDKLYMLFGKMHFTEYRNKATELRRQVENKRLFYLSVRTGVLEALALQWLLEPAKLLVLIHRLKKRLKNKEKMVRGDPNLLFVLYILEGQAYGGLLQVRDALNCARKCRIILRSLPFPPQSRFWLPMLYSSIGHYKEAYILLQQMVLNPTPRILLCYGFSLATAGEYRASFSVFKKTEKQVGKHFSSQISGFRAMCNIEQGEIQKALSLAELAFKESKKEGFQSHYQFATMILACGYAVLNEKRKAKELLTRSIPILKKFRMQKALLIRQTLLGITLHLNHDEKENITPPIRLALLLKKAQETLRIKDYRRACAYAKSQKIMGYFYLYLPFLPESVCHVFAKGKPAHLASRYLKLPVYQKATPTYNLRFLGQLRVYRNGMLVRSRIPPKESALLIHLCLKQGEVITLISLYRNFWRSARIPARTFSHYLVNIRKYLKLPAHSLYISRASFNEEKILYFSSHITTDYQEFEQTLAQAKALERAGEWGFAKKEYLRAFKLFRGEPFRKMYDNWSEEIRRVVLNKLETEAIRFAKSCLEHDNRSDAKKVLEKVTKIIPDSYEIKSILESVKSLKIN